MRTHVLFSSSLCNLATPYDTIFFFHEISERFFRYWS